MRRLALLGPAVVLPAAEARAGGALVRLGDSTARSGADGSATLTAPAAGSRRLQAERPGMVVSFPVRVKVG